MMVYLSVKQDVPGSAGQLPLIPGPWRAVHTDSGYTGIYQDSHKTQ